MRSWGGPLKGEAGRGLRLLRPACGLCLHSAAPRPSGRPSPTSLRSDGPLLFLPPPPLLFLLLPHPPPYPPKSYQPPFTSSPTPHQLDLHFPRPEKMTKPPPLNLLPPSSGLTIPLNLCPPPWSLGVVPGCGGRGAFLPNLSILQPLPKPSVLHGPPPSPFLRAKNPH